MGTYLKHLPTPALIFLLVILFSMVLIFPAAAQEVDDPELLEQGAQVYAENCAVCHGDDGQGRVGATLSKDWPSIRPDLRIRETIDRGVSGTFMPGWGQSYGGPLDDQELDAVTFYILSWESGEPRVIFPTPTIDSRVVLTPLPGVEGDPNRGGQLYAQNCAVCHGQNGEGRVGANLAQDWPSIRPDLRVKAVIESGVEGTFMPPWSQANGGPLTDQDINDITAYILTWTSEGIEPAGQEPMNGPLTGWVVWVILIGIFFLIVIAIVYYSRQKISED